MRTRPAKPGFFKDGDLAACEPLARILFLGLAALADRDGRLKDKPLEIKAEVLPHDAADVNLLMDQLAGRGLITRYSVAGCRYVQVSKDSDTFIKHARPHHEETSEKYPSPPRINPDLSGEIPASCAVALTVALTVASFSSEPEVPASEPTAAPVGENHSTPTTDAGSPAAADGARVVLIFPTVGKGPKEWALCEGKLAEYAEAFPGLNVLAESRKALQWCRDNPTKRKTPRGMPAFLGRWLERAQNQGRMGSPFPGKEAVKGRPTPTIEDGRKIVQEGEQWRREHGDKPIDPEIRKQLREEKARCSRG